MGGATGRFLLRAAVAVLVGVLGQGSARAGVIFESATLIQTIAPGTFLSQAGGVQTDREFFAGVNFELTETTRITGIGGHFYLGVSSGNNTIFGVIVPVASLRAAPASPTLDSGVLATTLITLPTTGTADIAGAVDVTLGPGFYGVIFGAGKFGATGDAASIKTANNMPLNRGLVDTYVLRQPGGEQIFQVAGARYFVEGTVVPEPSAALLGLLGGAGLILARRRLAN